MLREERKCYQDNDHLKPEEAKEMMIIKKKKNKEEAAAAKTNTKELQIW